MTDCPGKQDKQDKQNKQEKHEQYSMPCRFLVLRDIADLSALYMPFIKQGGLFIPSDTGYNLGDRVFLLLQFPEKHPPLAACGTVVWITPPGCRELPVPGIGVQLIDRDHRIKGRLEQLLADTENARQATLTL